MNLIQGGRFEAGFYAGAVGSLIGSSTLFKNKVMQLTVAAVLGGTASELGGGKFANGAISASFTLMFNHWLHEDNLNKFETSSNDGDKANSASDTGSSGRFNHEAHDKEMLQWYKTEFKRGWKEANLCQMIVYGIRVITHKHTLIAIFKHVSSIIIDVALWQIKAPIMPSPIIYFKEEEFNYGPI